MRLDWRSAGAGCRCIGVVCARLEAHRSAERALECRLQVFECFVITGVPGQGLGLFAEQRRQRGSMSAEILVEPTIEVCKAEKPL